MNQFKIKEKAKHNAMSSLQIDEMDHWMKGANLESLQAARLYFETHEMYEKAGKVNQKMKGILFYDVTDKYGRISFMFESDTVIGEWKWEKDKVQILDILCRKGNDENVKNVLQELAKECFVENRTLYHKGKKVTIENGYYNAKIDQENDAILRIKENQYSIWYEKSNSLFRNISQNQKRTIKQIGKRIKQSK